MKRFICLLLCVGGMFARGQSAPEDIRRPDFTISNAGSKGAGRIAFSNDGRLLAIGCGDVIRIYEVQLQGGKNPGLIQTLTEPSGVLAMTFRDTNTLVSLSADQTVNTWDVASGKMTRSTSLSFGKLLVPAFAPGEQPLLAGGAIRQVRLWNYQSGQQLKTFEVNDSDVNTLAFTSEGKLLAIGTFKGVVRVLDVAAWKVVRSVDLDTPVHALAASAKHVVVGYGDGTLAMLNFGGRSSIQEVEAHAQAVSAVAFSPNGDRFASGSVDGLVKVWDTETLKPICSLQGQAAEVVFISFSPDGKNLVSSRADGRVYEWGLPLE